jgi:hypothetical protein
VIWIGDGGLVGENVEGDVGGNGMFFKITVPEVPCDHLIGLSSYKNGDANLN